MLKNGGFEEPWGDGGSHDVIVIEPHGVVEREVGNIFTPPGWITWYNHRQGFAQPEVDDTAQNPDERRTRSGKRAMRLFTFGKRHDAGFLQKVKVRPGTKICLSAWAHAWSNHRAADNPEDFPHPDDARWSEGAGYDCVKWFPHQIPALSGDPQFDARGNFSFQLGIDPIGGTSPFSATVVWGTPVSIYNCYRSVPEVEAIAQAETVTVFLRSQTLWAFKHNDAYWDDVVLQKVEEPSPGPPPSSECMCPREQYSRSYILLPQIEDRNDAMLWRMAAAAATAEALETVGHSADDAAVGPLKRYITAVNPEEWGGDLVDFFKTYYSPPEPLYNFITPKTPYECGVLLCPPLVDQVAIGQRDKRWRDWDFGEREGGTVGEYGCFLTGLTMFFRRVGFDIFPPLVDVLLRLSQGAYTEDLLSGWGDLPRYFPSFFDKALSDNSPRTALQLQQLSDIGYDIVLRRADGKHFVLFERASGSNIVITDTWDGTQKTVAASYATGVRALRRATCQPPSPPPSPGGGPEGPTLSFHVQAGTEGLMEYVRDVRPSIIKLCHQAGMASAVRDANPSTLIIYRKVFNAWEQFIYPERVAMTDWFIRYAMQSMGLEEEQCQAAWNSFATPPYKPSVAAAGFLHWLRPELVELHERLGGAPFVCEGLNETIATGAVEDIRRVVAFEAEFAYQLVDLPYNAVPCVLNVAVGNPQHGDETKLLIPAARAAINTGGYVGYHAYAPAKPGHSWLESDFEHYAGRWCESWDPVFRAAGLRPKYLLTESGPIGGPEPPWHLGAESGWRECCANWTEAMEMILRSEQLFHASLPGREGRYWGQTLFTIGHGWEKFQFRQPQFLSLAQAVKE